MSNIIVQWLNRRKEEKAYRALVCEMRDAWAIVKTHTTKCYDTSYGGRNYSGDIVIVAEENLLMERRVRTICCPEYWKPEESSGYSVFMLWANKAEPVMPPRKALEAI